MHVSITKCVRFALVAILLLIGVPGLCKWRQAGIEGKLVLLQDKLFFLQVDGGLTVLDAQRGNPVLRHKPPNGFYRELWGVDGALILRTDFVLEGMDVKRLHVGWTKPISNTYWVRPNHMAVSANRKYLLYRDFANLSRLDPHTGQVVWTSDFLNEIEYDLHESYVLVKTADDNTSVQLLKASDGKVLWTKFYPQPDPATSILLHNGKAFIATSESGKASRTTKPLNIYTYNTKGTELDRLTTEIVSQYDWEWDYFRLEPGIIENYLQVQPVAGSRTDDYGSIHLNSESDGFWTESDGFNHHSLITVPLTSGTLFIYRANAGSDVDENYQLLSYVGKDRTKWNGLLPYLNGWWYNVSAVLQRGDFLFIGTNAGQVECIKLSSGHSVWKYVFPVYSPPRGSKLLKTEIYAETVQAFQDEYKKSRKAGGMILMPEDWTTASLDKIEIQNLPPNQDLLKTEDPQPMEQYPGLSKEVARGWLGVLIPFAIYMILLGSTRGQALNWSSYWWTLISLSVATMCLFLYALVSYELLASYILLTTAIALFLVFKLLSPKRQQSRKFFFILLIIGICGWWLFKHDYWYDLLLTRRYHPW